MNSSTNAKTNKPGMDDIIARNNYYGDNRCEQRPGNKTSINNY